MTSARFLWSAACLALLGACSDAKGTVSGGEERFDAGAPAPPDLEGGTGGDAGSGHAWTDLYRDYFGPTGRASCAGDGACHGTTSQAGYAASQYLCPPGDSTGCYNGITSATSGLLLPGDGKPFDQTTLHVVLRKQSGGGSMPKRPQYAFTNADLQRLSDWVAAGAKND